jgi:hypothetical protein
MNALVHGQIKQEQQQQQQQQQQYPPVADVWQNC